MNGFTESALVGLSFEAAAPVLENIVRGLHGRALAVEVAEQSYTDTETLHFPPHIQTFDTPAANFRLFKAMAIHQWAQIVFGTWRQDLGRVVEEYPDPPRALRVLHALETLRLDACVSRELPGAGRDFQRLREGFDRASLAWAAARQDLMKRDTDVGRSVRWLAELYSLASPVSVPYQGVLLPRHVEQVRARRAASEKGAFRVMLADLQRKLDEDWLDMTRPDQRRAGEPDFEAVPDEQGRYALKLGRQAVPLPVEMDELMRSIVQDMGEIPEDYLVAPGPDASRPDAGSAERGPADMWRASDHEEGAFSYDEWDYARQHYRKNYCVLREREVHPQWDEFVALTLGKYGGLVKSLRRTFEALRGDDCWLRRQLDGEDIDIDAVVEAFADVRVGMPYPDRLYRSRRRLERDVAVMFMVDMSGSTKGWINDAERESLVLLCEALETLADRYAIYGFSGMTSKRCEVYRIKRFDEPYSEQVHARISGIRPRDYTRMGVAIRHLSQLLNDMAARTKLLIALSDGKPDDYTDYRGRYGIEDTRQALYEARALGIHSFCITIDDQARDYLPHMYGAANYALVDDVAKLPYRVSDIYRRLTS